jgi:ATP-dependent RNA helicase DHX29
MPAKFADELEPRTPRTPHTPRAMAGPRTPLTPTTPKLRKETAEASSHGRLASNSTTSSVDGLLSPDIAFSSKPSTPLDAKAPAFVPAASFSAPIAPEEEERAAVKSRILESLGGNGDNSSSSERSSPEPDDDPHAEYVRIKLRIDDMTTHRTGGQGGDAASLVLLKKRLAEVENHYFFKKSEAEQQYQAARRAADANALQSRLRAPTDDVTSQPATVTPQPKKRPAKLKPSVDTTGSSAVASAGVLDGDEDEDGGGLLTFLDGPLTTETTNGVTIPVRDMGGPKQWSGRTPKVLLAETVRKVDRYAAITYRSVSGSSRARRAAVSIRADGGKSGSWIMEDIACQDEEQVRVSPILFLMRDSCR